MHKSSEILKHIKNNKLDISVKPNSAKNEIIGWDENKKRLIIKIKAVPEKGKANKEIINYLSKILKKKISIVKGSRIKKK